MRRSGQRQPTEKELERASLKANRRARRVGDTIEDFERVSVHGVERLAEALISRYTLRMDNLGNLPTLYRVDCLGTICPAFGVDFGLRRLGVPIQRLPTRFQGGWLVQLSWGVDSVISACRLLLVGQFAGAAMIARQQLELWTSLYASTEDIQRGDDESVPDFIARVWTEFAEVGESVLRDARTPGPDPSDDFGDSETSTEEPEMNHRHIDTGGEELVCPPVVYGYLSEILHARICGEAIAWEVVGRLDERLLPEDSIVPIRAVGDALSLCLLQMRYLTAAIAQRNSGPTLAGLVLSAPVRFSGKADDMEVRAHPMESLGYRPVPEPIGAVTPHPHCLMPLTPQEGLRPEAMHTLKIMAEAHEAAFVQGKRPAGRLYRDDEAATLVFASHRFSSALAAKEALRAEERLLGSGFNIDSLTSLGATYVLVTEFAGMCARWSGVNEYLRDAVAMASASLRTAFWLWLEDDDRAMAMLRCTLEQIARTRVWCRKQEQAEQLEMNPATTPRDWINNAGWRRLAPLNRVFGEFAHAHTAPRWDGARTLLVNLQMDEETEVSKFTGRRSALELMATLVARTCVELVEKEYSPEIGSVARKLLGEDCGLEMNPDDRSLDRIFNHIWQFRSEPLIRTPYPKTSFISEESEPN